LVDRNWREISVAYFNAFLLNGLKSSPEHLSKGKNMRLGRSHILFLYKTMKIYEIQKQLGKFWGK
jgi:hypothetical protein